MKIPSYIEAIGKAILNKITESENGPKVGKDVISIEEIAQLLFHITFHPFWIFWIVDIFMYFTKTYYDGNDMPLY